MTIESAKTHLIEMLDGMDKTRFNLFDFQAYANILKTISDIHDKSYYDCFTELISLSNSFRSEPPINHEAE